MSGFIIESILEAINSNTAGVQYNPQTGEVHVDAFSNLSKIFTVVIGESLVKHFNNSGDLSKLKAPKAEALEVATVLVSREYLVILFLI